MTRVFYLLICLSLTTCLAFEATAHPNTKRASARQRPSTRLEGARALLLVGLLLPAAVGAVGPVYDPATQADQLVTFKWSPPVPGKGRVSVCHSSVTPYTSGPFANRYWTIGGREPTVADSQLSFKVGVYKHYEAQHYLKWVQYENLELPADWTGISQCKFVPGKTLGMSGDIGFVIGKPVLNPPNPPVLLDVGASNAPNAPSW